MGGPTIIFFNVFGKLFILLYTGLEILAVENSRSFVIQCVMEIFLLEATAKISLLYYYPTCALNRTRGGQQDGGAWKAKQYIYKHHVYGTIWITVLREGFAMQSW